MVAIPLVSIVIPTSRDARFLPFALESALAAGPEKEVEILVVPNGNDTSWRISLIRYFNNPAVRVLPIVEKHANIARNHGLANARGKYIRFLDDDDYLYPNAARGQLIDAERRGLECSSGHVIAVFEDGTPAYSAPVPEMRDFVSASFLVSGLTLPVGNLFLRSCLKGVWWDEKFSRYQDYVWMMELAARREWRWGLVTQAVGAWRQHPGPRISIARGKHDHPAQLVDMMLEVCMRLSRQGRLDGQRASAVAKGLWQVAHRSFPDHPLYSQKVAQQALAIDPTSGPSRKVFGRPFSVALNPLLVEWLALPVRHILRGFRRFGGIFFGPDDVRRL